LGINEKKLLITYPVRVIRRKNIGEFILLTLLFSEEANWVVTQPPKNPVEIVSYEAWKQFCLKNNIKLVFEAGVKVKFEELILASDWCFTTSIQEGFGMVYMEPWLLGTPVGGRNLDYITADLSSSGMIFPMLYDQIQVETEEGFTDFATLNVDQQMNVISDLLNKRDNQQKTIRDNPLLKIIFEPIDTDIIESNRSTIINEYSLQKYAKRLEGIYQEFTK
jgi:glycosyltransferase involved in cell wall biosynthesis